MDTKERMQSTLLAVFGAGFGAVVVVLVTAIGQISLTLPVYILTMLLTGAVAALIGRHAPPMIECDGETDTAESFMGIGAVFFVLGVTDVTGTTVGTYGFLLASLLCWGEAARRQMGNMDG